jgi:hypothetical protein
MTTTRQRVNLTLTDMEQRVVEAILTEGTTEHDVFLQYLRRTGHPTPGQTDDVPAPGLADVVHVVLKLGMERLEVESAEISYAAEASAATEADRARTAALRRRLAASAARDDG